MSENAQQRDPDRNVDAGDPDVLLDIPNVSVDSIRLVVDGLDADISLRARLANLLQLDAGVRVHLHGVELDIDGVHAEAQLRVRLEQVVTLLGRALDTIDNNPQVIESLSRTASSALDDVNRGTEQLTAAGAAGVSALAQHSGVRDELARQAGLPGDLGDQTRAQRARPAEPRSAESRSAGSGSGSGSGSAEHRPAGSGSAESSPAGARPAEGQPPESRLKGRWPVDRASAQAHPTSAGQGGEGQRPPEGQDRQQPGGGPGGERSAPAASPTGRPADQPGGSRTSGPGESRAPEGGDQSGRDGGGGKPAGPAASGQGASGQAGSGQGASGQAGS
ncbi:hypothetical protein, partial [Micromonospora lupini]